MPFIPHTEKEVREMLQTIGVTDIEDLFDEIPADLRCQPVDAVPAAMSEMQLTRLLSGRAQADGQPVCFIGAGAYDHHIPAAVWQLANRGEFYSAYTPCQAEASQGTLQLLYEYQSMMAALTAMDVSNASLYDGASALAEAALMAVRANRTSRSKRILMPAALHPAYRKVTQNIVCNQGIALVQLPYDKQGGHTDISLLKAYDGEDIAALVIPQPNFFGVLEDVDELTAWAHANGALVIAMVNPLAMSLLKPPGEWGDRGADICCGDGQPLGAPLASGGPYFGFLCCRQALVRQMPGRIVGRTLDADGKAGFTLLPLQAREQHIRRSKATSNICTNQGLMVVAATMHMALLGSEGLQRMASESHHNTTALVEQLSAIPGVKRLFDRPCFHECALGLPAPAKDILRSLAAHNLLGGLDLSRDYPDLGSAILVCATERRNEAEITAFAEKLARVISMQSTPPCALVPKA